LSEDQKPVSKKEIFKSKKNLILSQDEILELAVKVIVNPTYGWITAALIIYGCRPIEIVSLIPSFDGTASVLDFDKNLSGNIRRKLQASPVDFVRKLNIYDQISQPFFYENFEDYDYDELNKFMVQWNNWFKKLKSNLELRDIRYYWVERILNEGVSKKNVAKYMGISHEELLKVYVKI